MALIQAWRVSAALGAPRRERNKIRSARDDVQAALADERPRDAIVAQQKIVATMRADNAEMVRKVRNVTSTLPVTLLGVLIALSLIIAGGSGTPGGPAGPRGARGPVGQPGPAGPRGPRGLPAPSSDRRR